MSKKTILVDSVKGENLHDKLINTIRMIVFEKDKLSKSEKEKVASILGDILCLGRESVYRRLRGEVRFSFEEVASIAKELGFSVDNIIGSQAEKKAIIELKYGESKDRDTFYTKKIESYASMLSNLAQMEGSAVSYASSAFPYILSYEYEELTKFRFFRYFYQMDGHFMSFKDFEIPKESLNAHRIFANEFRKINKIQIIINHDINSSIIRDIYYFHNLSLLDNEDLKLIRSELNEMLTEIEKMSITGTYPDSNTKIALYLSNTEIDSSYLLLEANGFQKAFHSIYDIDAIHTLDPSICKKHSLWIESLKRYSTLITFGGEIQRHNFFREQRKLINSIIP